jgi:hypothetical protein
MSGLYRALCLIATATFMILAALPGVEAQERSNLYLVPQGVELAAALPGSYHVVHDYGSARLVRLDSLQALPPVLQSRLHRLANADDISFRGWQARLPPATVEQVKTYPKGYYAMALVGPTDQRWRSWLEQTGIRVVATAHPFGLIVKADGAQLAAALRLETSERYLVVQGVTPLPPAARLAQVFLDPAAGSRQDERMAVRIQTFEEDALGPVLAKIQARTGRHEEPRLSRSEAVELVAANPEIGYVEPVYELQPYNNLAAKSSILNVEPVWRELGYNGSGVIVNHNDSGIDLGHPDLPPEAIVATFGLMVHSDTFHGTHTAGSVLGRGRGAAPVNSESCGDQVEPLPVPRGMAWGAQLATNNIFDGGIGDIEEMFSWGSRQGATISTNSWGEGAIMGPNTHYSTGTVAVDAAVRDADAQTSGDQEMAIFFAAGNSGPNPRTVGSPGLAKNAITIGATQNDRCGAYIPISERGPDPDLVTEFSSRGPSQGRIKPDLVAVGADVLSSESADPEALVVWDREWTGADYSLCTGTSMACPLAAGAGAVFREYYTATIGRSPSPALVKAALINGAVDLGYGYPSFVQGWGRLDLGRAIEGPGDGYITYYDQNESGQLTTGQVWRRELQVFSEAEPLEITLVWTDPPAEAGSEHPLKNDLDMVVIGADGNVYRGNLFADSWSAPNPGVDSDTDNNVEVVLVHVPRPGVWTIEVVATNVVESPTGHSGQDFAIVYSGNAAECAAPPAPTGVTATGAGDNRIDLTWEPGFGAIEYTVFRSLRPGGRPYQQVAIVDGATTSFSDTSVSGGIPYYYVVRLYTDCWSPYSEEVEAATSGACYLAPSFAGLDQAANRMSATCTLDLSWQLAEAPCSGEAVYNVYRSTESDFVPGSDNLVGDGISGTGWADSGLVSGRQYFYVVRAVDPSNGVEESNKMVRSGSPSGPDSTYLYDDLESELQGWATAAGSPDDAGTTVWTAVTGEGRFGSQAWFCSDDEVVKDQVLAFAAPLSTSSSEPVMLEYWQLFLFEEGWDGGRLEYSVDGGFSWHDILDGDGGSIAAAQRFLRNGYTGTLIAGSSANPLAGLPAWSGKSYGWRRVTVDIGDFGGLPLLLRWRLGCDSEVSYGGGWWIDDIRVFYPSDCQECLAPPAPAGINTVADASAVAINWSPVENAVEYQVLRTTSPGGPNHLVAVIPAPATSYRDDSVSGGTTYYYTLKARTDCLSDLSAEVVVTAAGECTLAPEYWGLASVDSPRQQYCALDLHWNPAVAGCTGSAVSYQVYRGAGPDLSVEEMSLHASGIAGVWYRDLDVTAGSTYSYLVRAVDGNSQSSDRNIRVLTASPSGPDAALLADTMESDSALWLTTTGSAVDSGTEPWQRITGESSSGEHAWFCSSEDVIKDQALALAEPLEITADSSTTLELWHRYDLEHGWDGGRLEYSVDGGASWFDILEGDGGLIPANPGRFLAGGYSTTLSSGSFSNPLAGTAAWTGNSRRWSQVRVSLADFGGWRLLIRWRLGCDAAGGDGGWWIDDVRILRATGCEPARRHPRRPAGLARPR